MQEDGWHELQRALHQSSERMLGCRSGITYHEMLDKQVSSWGRQITPVYPSGTTPSSSSCGRS